MEVKKSPRSLFFFFFQEIKQQNIQVLDHVNIKKKITRRNHSLIIV